MLIHSQGANTQDATVRLGIEQGTKYRLFEQPVVESKGILDRGSMSEKECSGHEDLFSSAKTKS